MSYYLMDVWKSLPLARSLQFYSVDHEEVVNRGAKAVVPNDGSVSGGDTHESDSHSKEKETSKSVDESFEDILFGCATESESVSHTSPSLFSSSFSWPKVLHDQINLLEQRKERMVASSTSIMEHKWSNCRPVHVMTEPLVDVLCVSLIHHDKNDENSPEVFGSIYVDDGTDKCFIYEQGKEEEGDSSTSSMTNLGLTGPHYFLSMESQNSIYLDLRDKLSGETVVCESAKLLTTITSDQPHQFEQIKTTTLSGTHSCALVKYMALTFGVFAGIEIQLFEQQSEKEIYKEEGQLEVYGTIFVEFNLLSCCDKVQINLFKIDKDCGDYERVDKESPNITLARSVVAVPAYSALRIHLNLVNRANNQPLVQDSLVFEPDNHGDYWEIILGKSGFNAKVIIDWRQPFLLDENQRSSVWSSSLEEGTLFLPNSFTFARTLVEVFSIFIGRQNNDLLRLHGMVNFMDALGTFTIFKRDKDDPYLLPQGCNMLPLEGIHDGFIQGDFFTMSVDLEDVENKMSIKGFISSRYSLNQLEEPWLNRLLCSVVKGTDHLCFAAVHYSVFKDAFKARLKVCIQFKGEEFSGDYMRVCGTIVSYYGDYGSHSDYSSLFYNSVLFQRSQENPYEKPSKNVALQLARSVVAVPNNSFLQIEVDLSCSISTRFRRHVKDMLNIEIGKEREVIQGDLVEIIIGVEWS